MTDSVAIEQLTIDDVNFSVADLPEELQAAVRKYEEWRDRYALAQDEVQLVASALRDLGAQIVAGVRAVEQEKAAAAVAAVEAEAAAAVEATEQEKAAASVAAVEAEAEAVVEAEVASEAMASEGAPTVVVAPGETLVVDDAS